MDKCLRCFWIYNYKWGEKSSDEKYFSSYFCHMMLEKTENFAKNDKYIKHTDKNAIKDLYTEHNEK